MTGPVQQTLEEAIRSGQWAELPAGETVDAATLRALLLGLNDTPRPVRLRGATVIGTLDLRDCAGPNNAPLPSLLLHDCRLIGDSNDPLQTSIDAQNARLTRISLRGSRFSRVDLSNTNLHGDLDLDDVAPLDDLKEGPCEVFARQCFVEGSVSARRARLRVPAGQRVPDQDITAYALHLGATHIRGSVLLEPDFRAEGGVSVAYAHIGAGIWAQGAFLSAPEHLAFSAQNLRCKGAITLRGTADRHCEVRGGIELAYAEAEVVDLRGVDIRPAPNGKVYGLVLAFAHVRADVMLKARAREIGTRCGGPIDLSNARIDGSVDLSRVELTGDQTQSWINTISAQIGGDLSIGGTARTAYLAGTRVGHDFTVSKSPLTSPVIHARNIDIGNDCRLEISGNVDLSLARIGGALIAHADHLSTFDAQDAEVRGPVLIGGTIKRPDRGTALRFDGGDYRGKFEIDGLAFLQSGAIDPSARQDPDLSFEDASIEGDLWVRGITAERVEIEDWAKQSVVDVREAQPVFYPGYRLIEARCRMADDRVEIVSFLRGPDGRATFLPGKAAPIHELNAANALSLDSERAVFDYLRFFCAYTWGTNGPFLIVTSKEELDGAELSRTVALEPPTTTKVDEDIVVNVRYADRLFRATMRVPRNGVVAMTSDEEIAEIVNDPLNIAYAPPVRIFTPAPKASPPPTTNAEPATETAAPMEAPSWLERICGPGSSRDAGELSDEVRANLNTWGEQRLASEKETGPLQPTALISFEGLKAGALRHNRQKGWGPGVRLKLEGFEYTRVEVEDGSLSDFVQAAVDPQAPEQSRLHRLASVLRGRMARVRAFFESPGEIPVERRHVQWLRRQYRDGSAPESSDDYKPQPYEQLARVLRNQGHYDEARRITLQKLIYDRRFCPSWLKRMFLALPEHCFRYGLSASRSVLMFLLLVAAGTLVFDFANYGEVGVPIGSERHARLIWPELDRPVLIAKNTDGGPASEARCGDRIEPAWYAMDVFVPLLDLHQEERCEVSSRDDAWEWRWFKSLYAVIGAFVTSMLILSTTGVLRRQAEQ